MASKRRKKPVHNTVTNSQSSSEKLEKDRLRHKKKGPRKVRVTPFVRAVVKAMVDNPDITYKAAGLQAGATAQSAASQAYAALNSKAGQEMFRRAALQYEELRDNGIAQTLAEGMKSTVTRYFAHEGQVIDERENVDFNARLSYTALVAKLRGLDPSANGKVEVEMNDVTPKAPVVNALASLTREELLAFIAATDSGKNPLAAPNPPLPPSDGAEGAA